jgi:hypothetical protein
MHHFTLLDIPVCKNSISLPITTSVGTNDFNFRTISPAFYSPLLTCQMQQRLHTVDATINKKKNIYFGATLLCDTSCVMFMQIHRIN